MLTTFNLISAKFTARKPLRSLRSLHSTATDTCLESLIHFLWSFLTSVAQNAVLFLQISS